MTQVNVSFIGKKARDKDGDQPYATFTGRMFGGEATFKVLKKYRNDDAAEYSAWLAQAVTPATGPFGDYGDTYVKDIVSHFSLTLVDGKTPTREQFAEIAKLRSALESDGTSEIYTMTELMAGARPIGGAV